jgi:hypothetical protein
MLKAPNYQISNTKQITMIEIQNSKHMFWSLKIGIWDLFGPILRSGGA